LGQKLTGTVLFLISTTTIYRKGLRILRAVPYFNTYKGETMNIVVALIITVAFIYGLYQLTIGDDDE